MSSDSPKSDGCNAPIASPTAQDRLRAIQKGLPQVRAQSAPTELDLTEVTRLEIARAELVNENERALIDLRKSYGRNMIRYLWAYSGATAGFLLLSGFTSFHLPDGVAVALVGGTAVGVLGVVGTIVAGLFRVKDSGG